MGNSTQEQTDPVDDGPVPPWIEWLTVALGGLFGVLLLAMAIDSFRRMHQLDAEYADLIAGEGPDLSVVDSDPAA